MPEIIIGALAAISLLRLVRSARSKGIPVKGYQWALTLLAVIYWVFVLEVVLSFLREGAPKGAVVMGTILGFIGVVWAVLLGRFVFAPRRGGGHA